jgi:hypothetical protein
MAEGLILEFTGVDPSLYAAVNAQLGIDVETGAGDWPDGLLTHAAGPAADGRFVVFEVWSSQAAQAAFMEGRLGQAMAAAGVSAVPKVTWIELYGYQNPG